MIKRRYYIKLQTEDPDYPPFSNLKPLTSLRKKNNKTLEKNNHSLEFIKNDKNKDYQTNNSLVISPKIYKQVCLIKYHNKNNQSEFQKYGNIFKLPRRYERMKTEMEKVKAHSIERPCRQYNETQLKKKKKTPQEYVDEIAQEKKKFKRYKKIMSIKKTEPSPGYGTTKNDSKLEDCLEDFLTQQIEQQEILPSNQKLKKSHNYLIESKVTKIQEIGKLKKIMLSPEDEQKESPPKRYQILKEQVQASKMQQRNPLKLTNFYLNQQIIRINQKIIHVLSQSQDCPLTKRYILPNEAQLDKFISSYRPRSKQISIQSLKLSPNFSIEIFNDNSIYDNDDIPKTKIYFGDKLNGKYNGVGVLITEFQVREGHWQSGHQIRGIIKNSFQSYQGEMKDSLKHGFGESRYKSGQYYEGYWEANLKSGNGYFKISKNESYFGEWKNGKFNGRGVLKTELSIYQGQFIDSFRHGFGKQKFNNGDFYEGDFLNNLPEGAGKYVWKTGMCYDGEFHNGHREGYGVLNAPSSVQYLGNFKNDLPSGKGKAIYSNGDQYHGSFFKGERSGRGDLMCKNTKSFYTGDWLKDALVYELS